MIRQIDSSLLDEWEKLKNPEYQREDIREVRPPGAKEAEADITRDHKAFTSMIRNQIFSFLRGLVNRDFDQALAHMTTTEDADGQAWTAERLKLQLDGFFLDHERIRLDPEARNSRHTYVLPSEDKRFWRVQQVLVDPQNHNDWMAAFRVDLQQSRAAREPVIALNSIGELGA